MDTTPCSPPPLPASPRSNKSAATSLKLVAIGILLLLLWICLHFIDGVRYERLGFREQARADVARSWSGEQSVCGPVLAVPCTYPCKTQKEVIDAHGRPVRTQETTMVRTWAYFLPSELEAEGKIDPILRRRGIFTVPVYTLHLSMRGRFRPNPKALDLEGAVFDWAHSLVCLRLSHPGGLLAAPSARWSEAQLVFSPGINRDGWGEALQAPADASSVEPDGIVFSIEADLKGSTRLAVVPSAGQNKLTLRSTWPDPSYGGSALPTHHETGPSGFVATWEQSYFGHGYPQQWTEAAAQSRAAFAAMDDSAVDVTLLQPVDSYRLVERAIKYGLLFLVLVFGIFFLFEVTAGLRIHPLQYLMVGAALVLFFLGYLALGEFIDGGLAYGVAATASTALVAGYSAAVLKTGLRSLLVGGGLAATYAYLYFILQLQDYSLLAGTAALFLLLGVAMWATRRIDWYGGK